MTRGLRSTSARVLLAVVTVALLASACTTDSTDSTDGTGSTDAGEVRLTPLSTRAEYVTNGDVLVALDTPEGTSPDSVRVELDGRDVTSVFAPDDDPRRARATPPGSSASSPASAKDRTRSPPPSTTSGHPRRREPQRRRSAVLRPPAEPVRVHHRTQRAGARRGRLLGPHPGAMGLPHRGRPNRRPGRPRHHPRRRRHDRPRRASRFPSSSGSRRASSTGRSPPSPPSTPSPGPVAGTVPGPTPARVWDDSGWNGRLVVRFGGGCGATFSQGEDGSGALDPELLADGYAVVTSTLTTFQTACNDVVSAETVMVAKEHFSEAYGLPRFTIGAGGSGGAIQQLLIAQNYPGLLDAVAPVIPFPDALSIAGGVADCGLLGRWFGDPAGSARSRADQRLAVTGFASPVHLCGVAGHLPAQHRPVGGVRRGPGRAGQVYDPVTNPRGARCTLQDSNVNLLGTDRRDGVRAEPSRQRRRPVRPRVRWPTGRSESTSSSTSTRGSAGTTSTGSGSRSGPVPRTRCWSGPTQRGASPPARRVRTRVRSPPPAAGGLDRRARAARQRLQRPDRRHPRPPAHLRHPRPAPPARRFGQPQRGAVDRTGRRSTWRRSSPGSRATPT